MNTNKTTKNTKSTKTKDTMQNGCFTSRFDNNPQMAKDYLECIRYLVSKTDGDLAELWSLYDNQTLEERETNIKKGLKRVKAKEAAFKPDSDSGLTKPANNVYNLFRQQYKEEQGDAYTKEGFEKAYKALKKPALAKLKKEVDKLNEAYNTEVEKLKNIAIYKGEHPPPKVKGACNTYAIFMKDCYSDEPKFIGKKQIKAFEKLREECKNNGKKHTENTKVIAGLVKEFWDGLSDVEKEAVKELATEDKLRFHCENYERDVFVLEAKIRFTEASDEHSDAERSRRVKAYTEELSKLRESGKPEGYDDYRAEHPAEDMPYSSLE